MYIIGIWKYYQQLQVCKLLSIHGAHVEFRVQPYEKLVIMKLSIMGDQLCFPPSGKPSNITATLYQRTQEGPSIGPPICREAWGCRTVDEIDSILVTRYRQRLFFISKQVNHLSILCHVLLIVLTYLIKLFVYAG